MTDATASGIPCPPKHSGSLLAQTDLMRRRNASEARFKAYGIAAIAVSLVTLGIMLWTIIGDGVSSFFQAKLTFPTELSADVLDPSGNRSRDEMTKITTVGYSRVLTNAFLAELTKQGISVAGVSDKDIAALISKDAAGAVRAQVLANPALVGTTIDTTVLAGGRIDGFLKGRVTMKTAERDSNVTPEQLQLAQKLQEAGLLKTAFNWDFLTNPDASDQRPEAAGLGVAILGSAYMMLIVLVTCVPVGVAASIYLEEFAPKNIWTDMVEVNISNLAAVPSIVFGILGLALFINFAGFPQSSSLVGALVLSLMTLPTIIIATRASIRAVPPSIRDAALGVGALCLQRRHGHGLATLIDRDHGEEAAVGMAHRALADVLGHHLDAHLHRGVAGVVDRRQEGHKFTHVHRLTEDHLVDRQGDYIAAGIAAGAGVGHFVEVLEQGAAMYVARKVGHVRGHQDGHAQLGVSRFHSVLTVRLR